MATRLVDVSISAKPTLVEVGEAIQIEGKATPAFPSLPVAKGALQLPQPPSFLLKAAAPALPGIPCHFILPLQAADEMVESIDAGDKQDGHYSVSFTPDAPAEYAARAIAYPYGSESVPRGAEGRPSPGPQPIGESERTKFTALLVKASLSNATPPLGETRVLYYTSDENEKAVSFTVRIHNDTQPPYQLGFSLAFDGDTVAGYDQASWNIRSGESTDATVQLRLKLRQGQAFFNVVLRDTWRQQERFRASFGLFMNHVPSPR